MEEQINYKGLRNPIDTVRIYQAIERSHLYKSLPDFLGRTYLRYLHALPYAIAPLWERVLSAQAMHRARATYTRYCLGYEFPRRKIEALQKAGIHIPDTVKQIQYETQVLEAALAYDWQHSSYAEEVDEQEIPEKVAYITSEFGVGERVSKLYVSSIITIRDVLHIQPLLFAGQIL